VAKGGITAWSCNPAVNGFQTTNDYVIGLGGEQVTEMGVTAAAGSGAATLAWQHTNVWAGGKLLGTYDRQAAAAAGTVASNLHFYLDDPLGTRRAQTDYAGVIEQTCSSLPYGDALNCTGGNLSAPTEHHFTGKERDAESGNDYFGARYYSSSMGRFMSPDWSAKVAPVPYAKLDNPQTLNLYGYLRNNPLGGIDADGHEGPDCGCQSLQLPQLQMPQLPTKEEIKVAVAVVATVVVMAVQSLNPLNAFHKDAPDPGKPGTRGKPDHQATAAEEADKIGGKTEVRIPTPGGSKETRVGDAVATDANGKPTAVTQVIRPTPAGNVPLREQKAAQDIENATGVKPKLVPVRPVPQQ